jgi:glycerol-3-phosphate dehydrogenase
VAYFLLCLLLILFACLYIYIYIYIRLTHTRDNIIYHMTYTHKHSATCDVAVFYADMCGLELPIFRCVHSLIHKKITPEEAVADLMGGRRSYMEGKV